MRRRAQDYYGFSERRLPVKIERVAAQLYTVRNFTKTPPEIAAAMKRVRKIGYRAVQVSGMGPIAEEELLRILDGEGLVCCATHEPSERVLDEPQRVVDRLRKLKCRHTAFPSASAMKLDTAAVVKEFAAKLNAAGKVLHDAGLVLSYHNHAIEFRHIEGRTILETIYAETDPRYLKAELDTYWVQYGGGSPLEWCRRMKNRLPLLHLKDYGVNANNQPMFAEIGRGNLNWKEIIPEAEKSGCEWFLVEQDICPGDPFDSLKISFDYLQGEFCS
jgi:sugar phosphate isomerase/epimerase